MTDKSTNAPGLDLALSWLQRSLDEITETSRRTAELRGVPLPAILGGPGVESSPWPVSSPVATAKIPAPAGVPPITSETPPASATPLLDKIGRDLTKLAAQGLLLPVIGREAETKWIIETLARPTKRNPLLLGESGIGKAAIVEGLALRIVAGEVPNLLLHNRVIEVPVSALTAGTQYRGQLEERAGQIVAEASQPGIILFIEGVQALVGAGQTEGGMGADQILAPPMTRGDIAVIATAPPEAYRKTIAPAAGLAGAFTTTNIVELDRVASRPVLMSIRDIFARTRGVEVSDEALDVLLEFADKTITNRHFPDKAIDLLEQALAHALVVGEKAVDREGALATTVAWASRASSTPALERSGRDLVALARDGKLGPIVGRDREIDAMIETLLRRTKRNPMLLGPAGSGKTAIVEGLAIRIAKGEVPKTLLDMRIFDEPLLTLAAAVAAEPSLLTDFLAEVRHPSIAVFFDEMHLLAFPAVKDLAESLKPALARGEIACIGATTTEEYQKHLESETALVRRFTEIPVQPMGAAAVHAVLVTVRDNMTRLRKIPVEDAALDELVSLGEQFMPNRSFPDKGIDLIEQSVSYAITHGRSAVDVATAREAVAALIGMPLDPTESIQALAKEIKTRALLEPAAAAALIARLNVSLRGLDAKRERPDAVILLCDGASSSADVLALAIASLIFGRDTARIDINLSGMTDDSSMSTLLGSAPGLIGSDRQLPLHELRRSPWQVVVLRGVDGANVAIRDTIAAALAAGSFTDAMGRKIPLGAAIIILTAPGVGAGDGDPVALILATKLGPALAATTDVVTGVTAGAEIDARAAWVKRELLAPLAVRLARSGYDTVFEASFVTWLEDRLPTDGGDPAAFLDREVTPLIAAALPAARGPLTIGVTVGRPLVRPAVKTAARDSAKAKPARSRS